MENTLLLQKIKDNIPKLTKSQRIIADYILKNTAEVAFLTIEQLAGLVGISTGSIMRLTFSLGYSGYTEFQKELQEMLKNSVDAFNESDYNLNDDNQNDLLHLCLKTQVNNIMQTAKLLSPSVLQQTLEFINVADRIYCVGVRGSLSVSHFLYYRLNRLLGNCELLMLDRDDLPEKMISLSTKDLIIVCSFPRYSKKVIKFVKEAKERGVKIVSITDAYSSPIAELSDLLLPSQCNSDAFHNSIIGPMFIADYLISAVAINYPERTSKHLNQLEELLSKWDYHYLD